MDELSDTATTLDRQLSEAIANNPLAALEAIRSVRTTVAEREREAVFAAIAERTWREIGDALGVTRQAVFQRFGAEWIKTTKTQMPKAEWKRTVQQRLTD